jgi:hypothetical protein
MVAYAAPRAARIDAKGGERRADHWLVDQWGVRVGSLGALPAAVMAGTITWSPFVAWSNGELVIARGRHFELEWRSPAGRVRQIMRLTGPTAEITDEQWQTFAEDAVPAGSSPANRKLVQGAIGPRPRATFPPHGRILADSAGRIWVSQYADPTRWMVFDRDARLLGRFQLRRADGSPFFALISVSGDLLQVREPDANGFTHLRWYRFRPAR